MALSIKHPEADHLARELAARTGESLTDVVINSLRERLVREEGRVGGPCLRDQIAEIQHRFSQLPVLDPRELDEILGYDENGLPT